MNGPITPRFTPSVASAPIFREIAAWWAIRLKREAEALDALDSPGPLSREKGLACRALHYRFVAVAADLQSVILVDRGEGPREQINGRYRDACAEAKQLLPGTEYGQPI